MEENKNEREQAASRLRDTETPVERIQREEQENEKLLSERRIVRQRPETREAAEESYEQVVRRAPQGKAVRRAPQGETVRRTPQGEAVRRAPQGEAVRRAPQGETVRRTPQGETVRRTPQGEAVRRTPQGETVRRAPQGETVRRAPQGETVRRTPQGETVRRTPQGETVRRTPQGETVRRTPQGETVRRTPQGEAVRRASQNEAGAVHEKKKGNRKGKVLKVLVTLLFLLIAVLGVCVWQIIVIKNGGTPLFGAGKSDIPTIVPPITEAVVVTEDSGEVVSGEDVIPSSDAAVTGTIPAETGSPTEAQTYQNDANGNMIIPQRVAGSMQSEPDWKYNQVTTGDATLDLANRQAAMYDYDAAIATIQSVVGYESNTAYMEAIADYELRKSQAVLYTANSTIPHVFFHTLIVDTSRAFDETIAISNQDGVCKVNDYNYVMTTVDEFCRIIEEMYRRDYVLVSIYDVAAYETQEDGSQVMKHQPIYLPAGKKPFVLSVDDVSYYEYMTGHGYATKLVVGEDGKVTNEYVMPDGSVIYGSYDVSTILDDFVETHPDFSYRGAKGIIALTGYEGVFGYRTSDYWYNSNCSYFTEYFNWNLDKNLAKRQNMYYDNPNIEQDKQTAKQVAEALKADGWLFASHTWGHNKVGDSGSYERFQSDTLLWELEVEPIIGDTDIIIYPQGEDLYEGSWRGYDPNNAKYQLLKNVGFDYFCSVDSNLGWTQIGTDYFRMGRANLDGQRMWEAICYYQDPNSGKKDRLETLFDSRIIFDWSRPTPVVK